MTLQVFRSLVLDHLQVNLQLVQVVDGSCRFIATIIGHNHSAHFIVEELFRDLFKEVSK